MRVQDARRWACEEAPRVELPSLPAQLSGTAKFLFRTLFDTIGGFGLRLACDSRKLLAVSDLTHSSFHRALKGLEAAGLVVLDRDGRRIVGVLLVHPGDASPLSPRVVAQDPQKHLPFADEGQPGLHLMGEVKPEVEQDGVLRNRPTRITGPATKYRRIWRRRRRFNERCNANSPL